MVTKYFENFFISKKGLFDQISKQKENKVYGKGIRVCFVKHTLSKKQLRPVELEVQTRPIFFLLGWIQPSHTGWAGSSQPDRLLVQTCNWHKERPRSNQFTRALHSVKVIIITFALFLPTQKCNNRAGGRRLTWAKTKTKTMEDWSARLFMFFSSSGLLFS